MRFRSEGKQFTKPPGELGPAGMKAVSQQHPRKVTAVERGATLLDALLFHGHPLAGLDFVDLQQRPHFHTLRARVKVKDDRLWTIGCSHSSGFFALWLHRIQLSTRLFAIAD